MKKVKVRKDSKFPFEPLEEVLEGGISRTEASEVDEEVINLLDKNNIDDPGLKCMEDAYKAILGDYFDAKIVRVEEDKQMKFPLNEGKEKKEEKGGKDMSLKIDVDDLRKVDLDNNTQAFADVQYGNLVLKGYKVMKNRDGELFVSPPSHPDDEGNWYPDVFSKSGPRSETVKLISKAVLDAFNEE